MPSKGVGPILFLSLLWKRTSPYLLARNQSRVCVALILTLSAICPPLSRADTPTPPTYRFGVLPLQSPNKLAGMFLPLTKALEARLHHQVQFVTAPSFSVYMQRVAQREYNFLYLNPLLCAQAKQSGYHVIAKVAGEPFTGILVVRRDSKITEIAPNRLPSGLRLGFPDPGAYAATVMTRRYLENKGISVNKFFKVKYFGSQDSALMALYSGLVDIAGTWRPSLRSMPKEVQQALRIVAETPPQPQMPIAVRDDTPASEERAVTEILVGLNHTADGRRILRGMALPQGFIPANDDEYAEVGK